MSIDSIPYQGDAYFKLSAVTDTKTGLAIIDATVTGSLFTLDGTAVSGAQNLTATYDATTQAYWGIIPRSANVVMGGRYQCQALCVKAGLQVPFYQEVFVQQFPA